MEGEFQDWEVLQNSEESVRVNPAESVFEDMEGDSDGIIRSDYFSVHSQKTYARSVALSEASEGSVESDNPSWIDPGPVSPNRRKETTEFWSDSGSDRSDERRFGDFELGFLENEKSQMGFDGHGNNDTQSGKFESGKFESGESKASCFDVKNELGFTEKEKTEGGLLQFEDVSKRKVFSGEFDGKTLAGAEIDDGNRNSAEDESLAAEEVKRGGELEKRRSVWWRVPLEFLKYCVFRVGPVWSFSVAAAALMGFVILGRRLYKMKRKTRGLELKITLDDKKVSQFMSRAARLNEVFSVVRRVPIVRPSLPSPGVTQWPLMSVR